MKNKIGILLIGGLVLLLIVGIILNSKDVNNRNKNHRYTIGVVLNEYTTLSGTYLKTKYMVNGVEYIEHFDAFGDPSPEGRKYFIKYEKDNPENAEIIKDYWANPDAIAPDSGWVKIPGIPDDEQP